MDQPASAEETVAPSVTAPTTPSAQPTPKKGFSVLGNSAGTVLGSSIGIYILSAWLLSGSIVGRVGGLLAVLAFMAGFKQLLQERKNSRVGAWTYIVCIFAILFGLIGGLGLLFGSIS